MDLEVINYFPNIIPKPFHLSYPHVFAFGDHHYMIPETNRIKAIELYRSNQLPHEWTKVKTLMDGIVASDTTVFFYNGKWWLFTTIKNETKNFNSFNNLHLFYSDDLLKGEWIEHPMNPIVLGNHQSRSAGPIFESKGKIIRPAQNCKPRYGYGVVLHEILELSTTTYKEKAMQEINPQMKNQLGVHTYTMCGEYIVTDILLRQNKF